MQKDENRLLYFLSHRTGKLLGTALVAGISALIGWWVPRSTPPVTSHNAGAPALQEVLGANPSATLRAALRNHQELEHVEIPGARVVKLLRTDNHGSRHQRWVVKIPSGGEITVVHNIDLAEAVPLSLGDTVDLAGELVYGARHHDPILHWTHSDPRGKRKGGFIVHQGKRYD